MKDVLVKLLSLLMKERFQAVVAFQTIDGYIFVPKRVCRWIIIKMLNPEGVEELDFVWN